MTTTTSKIPPALSVEFARLKTPSERMLTVDEQRWAYPSPVEEMAIAPSARVFVTVADGYCVPVEPFEAAHAALIGALGSASAEWLHRAASNCARSLGETISRFYESPTADVRLSSATNELVFVDAARVDPVGIEAGGDDNWVKLVFRHLLSCDAPRIGVHWAPRAEPNLLVEAHEDSARLEKRFHADLDDEREAWLYARDDE